jgi:ATP-dependent Zn protease
LVKDAFDTAKATLLENKDKMNAMVDQLMEKQILIQKDLE